MRLYSCEPYYLLQSSSCQLFNESLASQPVLDPQRYSVVLPAAPAEANHRSLCVNKHSIFAGRNPLVSSVAGCTVACDGMFLWCVQ